MQIIFSDGLRDALAAGGTLSPPRDNIAASTTSQACDHKDLNLQGDNDPLELHQVTLEELRILQHILTHTDKAQ